MPGEPGKSGDGRGRGGHKGSSDAAFCTQEECCRHCRQRTITGAFEEAVLLHNISNNLQELPPRSQETAVTAIGMVLGMLLTKYCSGSQVASWLWFLALTALHVWANLKAMRNLVLTSINLPRLEALLEAYADEVGKGG